MKKIIPLFILCTVFFNTAAVETPALDRIAVAEPDAKSGISADEISAISNYIESKLDGKFEIYSRASLKQILKENAFNDSGMVMDDNQQTQLAQKSVKYLFTYNIAKIGNRLSMTMMIVDRATGKINPGRRTSFDAANLEQLYTKIDTGLEKMGVLAIEADSAIKRLAILPVQVTAKVNIPNLAENFYNRFSAFILKSGSFEIVNRSDLKQIADESKIISSEMADSGQSAKVNQLKVADYIVVSEISRFENRLKSTSTAIAGTTSGKRQLKITLNIRIIEVKSGKVISQDTLDNFMESIDIDPVIRKDYTEEDYTNVFVDKAAADAGSYLLERLDPILVAAVEGDSLILSRGEGAGVKVGQIYQIFNPGKTIIHPKTKKVLGVSETLAGEAKIISIAADMSTAKIISGGDMLKDGAICRLKKAPPPEIFGDSSTEPAYPMAK